MLPILSHPSRRFCSPRHGCLCGGSPKYKSRVALASRSLWFPFGLDALQSVTPPIASFHSFLFVVLILEVLYRRLCASPHPKANQRLPPRLHRRIRSYSFKHDDLCSTFHLLRHSCLISQTAQCEHVFSLFTGHRCKHAQAGRGKRESLFQS